MYKKSISPPVSTLGSVLCSMVFATLFAAVCTYLWFLWPHVNALVHFTLFLMTLRRRAWGLMSCAAALLVFVALYLAAYSFPVALILCVIGVFLFYFAAFKVLVETVGNIRRIPYDVR